MPQIRAKILIEHINGTYKIYLDQVSSVNLNKETRMDKASLEIAKTNSDFVKLEFDNDATALDYFDKL